MRVICAGKIKMEGQGRTREGIRAWTRGKIGSVFGISGFPKNLKHKKEKLAGPTEYNKEEKAS